MGERPPDYRAPQAESLLRQVIEIVEAARPMPLSASSMINKEEVLALLQATVQGLPEELRAARWLLKERDDFLAKVQTEGDQIIATSRASAEQMVQRTELVKTAEERARRVVAEAEDKAREMKLETEDWCDQKLGAMEIVLDRTMRTVASGRSRLQGARPPGGDSVEAAPESNEPDGFFNQDDG
jgi:cell division septum initiation protein DivIVA